MRTTKKDRKRNAVMLYSALKKNGGKAAIYVENSRFMAVPFQNPIYSPMVIAEGGALGTEGCWIEFFDSILEGIPQKTLYEDGFKDWVKEKAGFDITYNDGKVIMIEV